MHVSWKVFIFEAYSPVDPLSSLYGINTQWVYHANAPQQVFNFRACKA